MPVAARAVIEPGALDDLVGALGRLPTRLVVFGIEAGRLQLGDTLSSEVADAVQCAADGVRDEVLSYMNVR